MANHPAAPLLLRQGDRERLLQLMRSTSVRAGLAQRARIVLLAAECISNTEIAQKVGATRTTVIAWRVRYTEDGIEGLADHDRSGRPRRIDHRAIVATTLRPPPKKLGVTHWSSRLLAARLGIDHTTVAKAWREYGVHP
jgi:TyrR family helix-turn-helix protein